MLELCTLGTGGTLPLADRALSSLYVRVNGRSMLIDCGEGTQVGIRKLGWGFRCIEDILLTHFHGDHCTGLAGLLLSLEKAGKTEPLHIWGPKGLKRVVEGLCVIVPPLGFPVLLHELPPEGGVTANSLFFRYAKANQILWRYNEETGKYYRIPQDAPAKTQYSYPHSPEYLDLEKEITEAYPLVNFQMWELIQMNDFVNHQIAKNVIFIEVEAMLVDTVYELLHEKYPYAMIQPASDTFYKQRAPETDIIVQKLLSEAWGTDFLGESRTVDVHIQKLRRKLKLEDHIKTIYKNGYRFEE